MSRFCDNLYRLLINAVEEKQIKKVVKQVTQKIQSTKTNQIPRSISLFQYFRRSQITFGGLPNTKLKSCISASFETIIKSLSLA